MRNFIDDGYLYVRKVEEQYYVISKTGEGPEGYGLCPNDVDATGLYDFEEVKQYWTNNPDKRFEYSPPEPTAQELIQREVSELKHYLADTDYAVIKCYDRGLNFADEYPDLYQQRQEARDRINELENL